MDHSQSMLYSLRLLSQSVKHNVEKDAREHSYSMVSPIQMMILDYLSRCGDELIFQKDIADRFHIRNSSVTVIIRNMEKNGVIERKTVESDGRFRRICITDKGVALSRICRRDMDNMENILRSSLTEEELECFFGISEKLIKRLDKGGSYDKETC